MKLVLVKKEVNWFVVSLPEISPVTHLVFGLITFAILFKMLVIQDKNLIPFSSFELEITTIYPSCHCVCFVHWWVFIVESPRWLLDNDMDQQGFNVLSLLYDSHHSSTKPKSEFFMIKNSILRERKMTPKSERTWRHLLKHYKKRVFVACSSLIFAQLNGINIISYYAPLVFQEAGFDDAGALLMTGVNGIIYLLSTIPPWFLVDRWGRRPILISSGLAMGICLILVSVFMLLNRSYTASVVAVLVIIYNASFGFGFGPIPFLLSGESYPLSVRSKGVSLAVACNWLSNFIVGLFAPILRHNIKWAMYLFPAGSCFISIVCVILFYLKLKVLNWNKLMKFLMNFIQLIHSSVLWVVLT